MLQSIRDRTHGWIAGVIISLIILSFALWGIHSYLEGIGNSDVVAKVNGTEITKQQLAITYTPMRNQLQASLGTGLLPERVELLLKRRALDTLINVQVLKQASIAQNYRVSELQLENYLQHMPEFQVNGQFSLDRFKQLLANNNIAVGDFFQMLHTTLLVEQPKSGIVLTSFALPDEISNSIALINQERDVSYAILPLSSFLNADIKVTEEEISAYYQNHQDEFKLPEQVSVNYVVLSTKDLAGSIHSSPTELKNYYTDNINNYTLPGQWKLSKILIPVSEKTTEKEIKSAQDKIAELQKKIEAGSDFASLAREYPAEDKQEGWVAISQMPIELHQAVSLLTKKDQVSEPIKVSKGLMLVKAIDVKPAQVQPFDQVKEKVAEHYVTQLAQEKFAEAKEKLASLTYEHSDSLEPAAKALGLTIKTSQLFSQTKPGDDFTKDKRVRDVAFTSDVLSSQNNSDAIQLDSGTVTVLRVKSHVPASMLSLNNVKNQITEQIKKEKADQKVDLTARDIKKKLDDGASREQIAQQFHVAWNNVGYITRDSKKLDPAIIKTVFRMPRLSKEAKASYATTQVPTGYAVVGLQGIKDGTTDSNDHKQSEVFTSQLENAEAMLEYKLYAESLTNKAKIKVYGDYQEK